MKIGACLKYFVKDFISPETKLIGELDLGNCGWSSRQITYI